MADSNAEHRRTECESLWKDALLRSRQILGDDDFATVQGYKSAEDLLNEIQKLEHQRTLQVSNAFAPRLLKGVRPHILRLQYLVTFLVASLGSASISYASFWGATYLLLNLAARSEDALEEISSYLRQLGQSLELFQLYQERVALDDDTITEFFNILVQLLLDSAGAIKYLRKNDRPAAGPWESSVRQKFKKTIGELTGRLDHLRKIVEAQSLIRSSTAPGLGAVLAKVPHQGAQVPYHQLPFGKNPNFYGRSLLLADLGNHLWPSQGSYGVHSAAVWGTAGIGKSQIALEYAFGQIVQGCQLIIWLPCETASEISGAICEAAARVRPPGYADGDSPDKMRLDMWNWLQVTDASWLLIFDNVESNDLLRLHWPRSGSGQVLVTCCSELIARSPAARAFEVPAFSNSEAGELLLQSVGKSNAEQDERQAAEEIAAMLGGLALGIDIIGRQIMVKRKTMQEFLPYFISNKPSLRVPPRYAPGNPYYSKNLATAWETAFNGLSEGAAQLLGVISFIAPDGIPRAILDPYRKVPGTWSGEFSYEEAEGELYYFSLIKINDTSGTLSIHRLTQEAYYYYIDDHTRFDSFRTAYLLLAAAFPKRLHGRHLYETWAACEQLIHHVDAVQNHYQTLRSNGLSVHDVTYGTLMANATWYCAESSDLKVGERIGLRAADNCQERDSLQFAYICESIATVAHRGGRYQTALHYFQEALRIRLSASDTSPQVRADSHSAVGLALFGLYRPAESIEKVNEAIAIARRAGPDEETTFNIDRYLRNRARPSVVLGLYDQAICDLDEADRWHLKIYGAESHFHGETSYTRGVLASRLGKHDQAIPLFQAAHAMITAKKPMHSIGAAAKYREALAHLGGSGDPSNNDEAAVKCLRAALQIAQFNEPRRGDAGASARIRLLLADVLSRQGQVVEAAAHRAAAETVKLELELSGLYPAAPTAEDGWSSFLDVLER